MDAPAARATAAWGLASAVLGLALAPGAGPPAPCPRPVELEARGGHSAAVRCDGAGPPLRGPARRLFGLAVDPNRADAATLETLPGIGPARARAIVAAREARPFDSVSALTRVPGIGPRTLERLAPLLAVATPLEAARRSVE